MGKATKAIEEMQDAILLSIKKLIADSESVKVIKCRVTEVIDSNKYKVFNNGSIYTVKARWTYNINDIVYVMVLPNNYNDMFIIY
ncbi:hypothetical protein [Anaerocolumna xylanovorans]|uniref:Uncharacterized protein n=1 Tax=Anaerocolumna xylanovorans DSM 12503 TaxID=1121345 RepID=A0A1M7YM68_9FIRM|nr:hypothetical protein [Anaerocolumna xylanovorans]SHO53698.1 hypothetical protein SAMN02745217_04243 [Anaerocolumna xylanovorans DSM 12503]